MKKRISGLRHAAVAAVIGLALAPGVSFSANKNPGNGLNVGQLKAYAAAWWQWALSTPVAGHPLAFVDPVGSAQHCGGGQHGDVWFLCGLVNASSPANRACTIPAGTSIFFPVINAECSTIEGNGTTEGELRACAKDLIDFVTVVETSVDGVPIRSLDKSRAQSNLFAFSLPPDDVLGLFGDEPNPSAAVADGYWVLLSPLPEGEHTIYFRGVVELPGFTFEQRIAYAVTVVPALR